MANKCKLGYKLRDGKCVKSKRDTFFRPESGFKKGILWTALIAIILGGILGATFLLFGEFNETTTKILLTTLILGLGSFAMLGFSRFDNLAVKSVTLISTLIVAVLFVLQIWEITNLEWYKIWVTALILLIGNIVGLLSFVNQNQFLKWGGAVITSLSALLWSGLIWEVFEYSDNFLKLLISISIIAFTIMHIALISYSKGSRDGIVRTAFWIVVALITAVTGMLIYLIINLQNMDFGDMYFRILGFVAVLDVAGSIALPILKKVRG